MKVNKAKKEAAVKLIRANKLSYAKIGDMVGLDTETVRQLAKPYAQERWQRRKARDNLDKICREAKYDRITPVPPMPVIIKEPSGAWLGILFIGLVDAIAIVLFLMLVGVL